MSSSPRSFRPRFLLAATAAALGCTAGGESLDTLSPRAPLGNGPRVVWDLGHRPLPEVPLPNDVATFPDPSSPTGLRLNASLIAPTGLEQRFRAWFDEMDGWGTFMPIAIPFDGDIDVEDFARRQRADGYRFADDAVYLVDLATGIPVPLDAGHGNFVHTLRRRDNFWPNDPRANGTTYIYETEDEPDLNHNGVLERAEDTNFDGIRNRAAVWPAGADPVDHLTPFWEPDSHTLIVRPVLPLREQSRYAVLVTSRLRGAAGSVRSAFDTVAHPTQGAVLAGLDDFLRRRPDYFGNLRYRPAAGDVAGADRVVFAYTFSTQSTASELLAAREGLYGRGTFQQLANTRPELHVARVSVGANCSADQTRRPFLLHGPQIATLLDLLQGESGPSRERVGEMYRHVEYIAIGRFTTPFLMGDPRSIDLNDHWNINARTGEIQHATTDTVQFMLIVPRAREGASAPFPVAVYGHGYGANMTESLTAAGNLAANGIATIAIQGPGHGLPLGSDDRSRLETFLRGQCLGGMITGLQPNRRDRARDLNLDGLPDPAGDFWTSYLPHTRDNLRQLVLDQMQLIRAMRGFDGTQRALEDFGNDGDDANDVAGDFNGDGTPDIGGPNGRYYAIGESLGGISTMILGSAEASIRAATPFAGGGGLADIAIRSTQGGVKEAVHLRLIGPLVASIPSSAYPPRGGPSQSQCDDPLAFDYTRADCALRGATTTSCRPGQNTLRFILPDNADTGELEFACLDTDPANAGNNDNPAIHPGDDVIVTNRRTGEVRCARAGDEARWRVGVPTDLGDGLRVDVYRGDAVWDYGTCAVASSAVLRNTVNTYRVVEGDCGVSCGHYQPYDYRGTATYRRVRVRGTPLYSPAEGLGLRRQSPGLRRLMNLAQAGLDAADPITYAPLYFLRRPAPASPMEDPRAHQQHALLVVNTVGDMNVPVNTGNAFSRAAGLIPFFGADAPAEYSEYAAPQYLTDRYGGRTPNQLLIDRHVLEGIPGLNRWPTAAGPNLLFDVDDLDEGQAAFGELTESVPLRLVRLAEPQPTADRAGVEAVWSPGASGPLAATLNYYVRPTGHHSVDQPPHPELLWDYTTYMYNLVGRLFATDGRDVYYRSNPTTHHCLERHTCAFLPPIPPR